MTLWGFDTETYLITDRTKSPKPVCCTWAGDGDVPSISRPDDPVTFTRWSDPEAHFVGANIAYDVLALMHWHPHLIPHIVRALDEGRVWDVTVRECLMHLANKGRFGYNPFPSLNDLTQKYLGIDLTAGKSGEDAWRLRYGTLQGVPLEQWPQDALNYALMDAVYPRKVFEYGQGGIRGAMPTEALQVQASVVLGGIGSWGFGINVATNRELGERQRRRIAALQAKLDQYPVPLYGKGSQKVLVEYVTNAWLNRQLRLCREFAAEHRLVFSEAHVGVDIAALVQGRAGENMFLEVFQGVPPGSRKALLDKFRERVLPIPRTPKGAVACGVDTLKHIYDEWQPFKDLIDFNHEVKLNSTYVRKFVSEPEYGPSEKLPEGLAVSRANYKTLVSTGRTAASPGHQTVPREDDMRSQFQARPGFVFGVVDYSGQELSTLAANFRFKFPNVESQLAKALWEGRDLHAFTASMINNRPYEEYISKREQGKDKVKKEEPYRTERQGAKPANFGFPGGMRERAFIGYAEDKPYFLKINMEQAAAIRAGWVRAFPELDRVHLKEGMRLVKSNRGRATATTIHGRAKANCSFNEFCNYQFQALAADCSKTGLWMIYRECLLANYHWRFPRAQGYCEVMRDSPLRLSKISAFIHDEIVCEHPDWEGIRDAAFKRQQDLMVQAMDFMCMGLAPVSVEGELGDRWQH